MISTVIVEMMVRVISVVMSVVIWIEWMVEDRLVVVVFLLDWSRLRVVSTLVCMALARSTSCCSAVTVLGDDGLMILSILSWVDILLMYVEYVVWSGLIDVIVFDDRLLVDRVV